MSNKMIENNKESQNSSDLNDFLSIHIDAITDDYLLQLAKKNNSPDNTEESTIGIYSTLQPVIASINSIKSNIKNAELSIVEKISNTKGANQEDIIENTSSIINNGLNELHQSIDSHIKAIQKSTIDQIIEYQLVVAKNGEQEKIQLTDQFNAQNNFITKETIDIKNLIQSQIEKYSELNDNKYPDLKKGLLEDLSQISRKTEQLILDNKAILEIIRINTQKESDFSIALSSKVGEIADNYLLEISKKVNGLGAIDLSANGTYHSFKQITESIDEIKKSIENSELSILRKLFNANNLFASDVKDGIKSIYSDTEIRINNNFDLQNAFIAQENATTTNTIQNAIESQIAQYSEVENGRLLSLQQNFTEGFSNVLGKTDDLAKSLNEQNAFIAQENATATNSIKNAIESQIVQFSEVENNRLLSLQQNFTEGFSNVLGKADELALGNKISLESISEMEAHINGKINNLNIQLSDKLHEANSNVSQVQSSQKVIYILLIANFLLTMAFFLKYLNIF